MTAIATPLSADVPAPPVRRRVARRRAGAQRYVACSIALHLAAFGALRVFFPESLGIHARPAVVEVRQEVTPELAPDPEPPPPPPPPPERPPIEEEAEPEDAPLISDWTPADALDRGPISVTDPLAGTPRPKYRPRPRPAAPGQGTAVAPPAPPPPAPPPAPEPPPREPVRVPVKALSTPAPDYPEVARSAGVEGVVRLVLEILEDGTVGEVEIADSSGSTDLDAAAVRAVKRWKFEPERVDGVARRARVRIPPIRFRLDAAR